MRHPLLRSGRVLAAVFATSFILTNLACTDDGTLTSIAPSLDGQWEFTLAPDKVTPDASPGKEGAAPVSEATPAVFSDVFLFEAGGSIEGVHGPLTFEGTRSGNAVTLDVYEPADGVLGLVDERLHASTMTLTMDAHGRLTGSGEILLDHDGQGLDEHTYLVSAHRTAAFNASVMPNFEALAAAAPEGWLDKLCDAASSLTSKVVGLVTDGTFRPMGGCWGSKDGGGYYLFGDTGPGSSKPLWTQTIYYPWEWGHCAARTYQFDIDLEGDIHSIEELKNGLSKLGALMEDLGFSSVDHAIQSAENFFEQYGGFALSAGYSTRSNNLSIYLNRVNTSGDGLSAELVTIIGDVLAAELGVSRVWWFDETDAHDTWTLRRSLCGTPLIFFYIFGTHKVRYN